MFCKQLNFPSEKTCWVLILVLMRGFLCDRVLAAVFWLLLGHGGLEPVFTGPVGDRQCWVNAPSDRSQQVLTWGNVVSGSRVAAACELGWVPCCLRGCRCSRPHRAPRSASGAADRATGASVQGLAQGRHCNSGCDRHGKG